MAAHGRTAPYRKKFRHLRVQRTTCDPEATLATVRFTVADRPCTSNLLLRRYLRCGFSVCVVLGLSIITPFTATTAKSGTVTANHAAASERGATLKYE